MSLSTDKLEYDHHLARVHSTLPVAVPVVVNVPMSKTASHDKDEIILS